MRHGNRIQPAPRPSARETRQAIEAARSEYANTLVQIAQLEQDLLGKVSHRHLSIGQCVQRCIPTKDTFTTQDIMAGLEALDDGRVWRKRSVDYAIGALRRKGLIKRLKRATIHEPAVYVRSDVEASVTPTGDARLIDVIRRVAVRPMTTVEIAVAAKEAGYQTSMKNHNFRMHVARLLNKNGFKLVSGKWVEIG